MRILEESTDDQFDELGGSEGFGDAPKDEGKADDNGSKSTSPPFHMLTLEALSLKIRTGRVKRRRRIRLEWLLGSKG